MSAPMEITWEADPHCLLCRYLCRSLQTCDYYLITGRRRPSTRQEVEAGQCAVKWPRPAKAEKET